MGSIRPCRDDERVAILGIVNAAAEAYRGVIPADRWREPYMPPDELDGEIAAGVVFWGYEADGALVGIMGIQQVRDVDLIRHAYVAPVSQRHGVGGALLEHLMRSAVRPMLVGTWSAADWAIRFYRRHGFEPVSAERKAELLKTYWNIPDRQIETSVVLAAPGYARNMPGDETAAALAAARVATARDMPEMRLGLAAAFYDCRSRRDSGTAGFGRSELAFLKSQIDRGVMNAPTAERPGSPWWRSVNERLLRDTTESGLVLDGHPGPPTARSVEIWLEFLDRPSAGLWYRAHNASIVAGFLEHEALAAEELLAERFFMNVALLRVLYTHALAAEPGLALGRLAPLGRLLGDPRGGMVDVFLSVDRVFPKRYPLDGLELVELLDDEHRVFRAVDYGLIGPRVAALYDFAADALEEPRVRGLVRDGTPSYSWPADQQHHWLDGGTRLLPRLLARVVGHRSVTG